MKLTVTHFFKGLLAAILLLLTTAPVAAQDSCTFRLRIYDYYGDTWDDSYVYVRFGNNPERGFTHTGAGRRADSVFFYNLRVRTGDSIFIRYQIAQDLYQNEAQYTLYDNVGEVIFQDGDGPNLGTPPRGGSVYKGVAKCRNCGIPINPVINEIRTFTATARWRPASQGFQPTYFVEWDTAGFLRGRGRNKLNTTDTFAVLNNLTELVKYNAYIGTVCFGNDSSTVIGPIAFLTDTASDVGITRIITPIGRCDLGVDSVKIVMTNIGGAPQQLIPFKYSVNGVLAPVQQPADGLYTGVLSKDSSVTIAFKALSDFSAIGEYEIKAWTDLSGDKNRKNDTTRILITHPRTIATYPYAQDFEAGKDTWSVIDSIGNSTWQYGTPRWKTIKGAASGTKAWTTWADSSYRDGELGYVLSPCLDFTTFTADPRINFYLNVNTEATYDGMWLESSIDGGRSWQQVGTRRPANGVNWYNDSIGGIARPTWGGIADSTKGWRLAQNILRGTAGKSQVRVRFAFRSDESGHDFDGVAFDNILISAAPTQDFTLQNTTFTSVASCADSVINTLVVPVTNLGSTAQRSFTVSYQINGGAIQTETLDTLIQPNATIKYKLTKVFRTATAGNYNLKAWVGLAGDQYRGNDTINQVLAITLEKPLLVSTYPYYQDFENGTGTWSPTDSLNGTWGLVTPTNPFINSAASGVKCFKVGATTPDGTYNNNEWSYLNSPCFDFTRLAIDPRISFAINYHTEGATTVFDGAWLEGSQDGGTTWTRIGTRNTGVNWYADTITAAAVRRGVWGSTKVSGWRFAQNTLAGFAGKPNCRFRFVFRSDGSVNTVTVGGIPYGGIAVDNIFIGLPSSSDLAAGPNARLDVTTCGNAADSISLQITNVGSARQYRYTASYRVDNNTIVTEQIDSLNIAVGATVTYKFKTPFNSTAVGSHTITAWVRQTDDTTRFNDTLRSTFIIVAPIGKFASYNFDDGVAPQYWLARGSVFVGIGQHGNAPTNGCVYSNIWSSSTAKSIDLITHRFGPVGAKDSVSYDYRMVKYGSPYAAYDQLTLYKDTLYLQVATDCADNFVGLDTITAANHVVSNAYRTRKLPLAAFQGKTVRFRLRMNSQTTDFDGYWIDLDNINFLSCPESFNVQASVRNTSQGQSRGSIALRPQQGLQPFTYKWSNNATTDSISNLAAGTYLVTITDGRGCTQTATYTVVGTVGTFDISSIFNKVTLAPNPTTGNATLDVEFSKPTDARVQVLNIMGQLLYETRSTSSDKQQYELELNNQAAGVYLVRIIADNRTYVARLVKQ